MIPTDPMTFSEGIGELDDVPDYGSVQLWLEIIILVNNACCA